MSNIEEFEKYWYKPLQDSMKIDGNPDNDLFRYKDLGKQSALLSWIECCRLKDVIIDELEAKNRELEKKLKEAESIINMVMDNRKMPHKHLDYFERLCCLSERAKEYFEKYRSTRSD